MIISTLVFISEHLFQSCLQLIDLTQSSCCRLAMKPAEFQHILLPNIPKRTISNILQAP